MLLGRWKEAWPVLQNCAGVFCRNIQCPRTGDWYPECVESDIEIIATCQTLVKYLVSNKTADCHNNKSSRPFCPPVKKLNATTSDSNNHGRWKGNGMRQRTHLCGFSWIFADMEVPINFQETMVDPDTGEVKATFHSYGMHNCNPDAELL